MQPQATILVIDDEESMRDSCSQLLTKEGYRVETAESGEEGLRKMDEVKPDLVLIDLKMPGMNGAKLLEEIRDKYPDVIRVVITGYATIDTAVDAMKRGAYDFLPKPFTPDELRIIIRRGLERRRLAEATERLRREKERLRENFVAIVSHQLRTPLVAVNQYLDALLSGRVGALSEQQENALRHSKECVDRMLQLIGDWMTLSRVDSGKLVETFEQVSLATVIGRAIDTVKSLAEEKGVSIESEVSNALPDIRGDRKSLEQLFTNLLSNAVKFNVYGGKVRVRAKEEKKGIVVEVEDTGIGIPKEELPLIFEEFHTVKREHPEQRKGTGLGLSIAKKIAEAHSGNITVRSEPGKGSCFTVYLPIKESEG